MPRMTRANARQMVTASLKNFVSVTGESVGIVYSWKGGLSMLGTDTYKSYVKDNKEAIWRNLGSGNLNTISKPDHDLELIELLEGDVLTYSVPRLRKLVCWVMQKYTGKSRNIWSTTPPLWWLKDVPFKNIYKQKFRKATLQQLLQSYQSFTRCSLPTTDPMPMEDISEGDLTYDISSQSPTRSDSEDIQNTDMDSSSESFFPQLYQSTNRQPDQTYDISSQSSTRSDHLHGLQNTDMANPSPSLAELCGAKTIFPIATVPPAAPLVFSKPEEEKVEMKRIKRKVTQSDTPGQPIAQIPLISKVLDEDLRAKCMAELSSPETFLTGSTMNAFCEIIKHQYPKFKMIGLQDPILSVNREFVKPPVNSFQVHHDGQLHWVTSFQNDEGKVFLYDSMFTGRTSEELDVQLASLYSKNSTPLQVTVPSMQQQRGGANCGVFAAATCLALATGQDPSQIRWRQIHMRAHMKECFHTEILKPFPSITQMTLRPKFPTSQETVLSIPVSCICNLPAYAHKYMIECPDCSTWYHKPCAGLLDIEEDIPSYLCYKCVPKRN